MTSLKEATREVHDQAEHTEWSKLLVSGTISKPQYVHYLYNLLEMHHAIEHRNVISKPEVLRVPAISHDIDVINESTSPMVLDSTWKYIAYLKKLPDEKLWCHIYCHYLGYMYGGQVIKKAIPFSCTMLDFDDRNGCITYVRDHLNDADHEEAREAFRWATKMFDDLWVNYKDEK